VAGIFGIVAFLTRARMSSFGIACDF